MPISDEPNKILYYTDGTVREFSFNFKFFNTSDIHVSFWTEGEGVYLEENKDYEIDYTDKEGGSVVLLGNRGVNGYPATPHPGTLLISRVMPLNQQANIRPVSGFPEEVITNTFDKLVMIDQQQEEEIQRCLKLPGNSLVSDLTLPEPVANNSLIWDEDGTKLVNYDLKGENEAFKQEIVELNQVLEGNINTQFNNFKSETNQQFSNFKTEINDNIETFKNDINTNIEEVLEASEKVNQLEQSVTTATNASKVATEQATIAKQQASIATNKANEAINASTETKNQINTRANLDLSNLSATGEKHFLNKTQITNGIFSVEKLVNVFPSTDNGQLVLMKGSIVYVSTNGTFNEVTIQADVYNGSGGLFTDTGSRNIYACYVPSINEIRNIPVVQTYSQATAPTASMMLNNTYCGWLDTTNNIMKYTYDGGATWTVCSLPFALGNPQAITGGGMGWLGKLKVVFNGFGVVGQKTFTTRGVKALLPNGKNLDETFNNKETITTTLTFTEETGKSSWICFFDGTRILTYGVTNYFEQDEKPTGFTGSATWLNTQDNIMYNTSNGGATWTKTGSLRCYLGKLVKAGNGVITEFEPNKPVELVKKADLDRAFDNLDKNLVEIDITSAVMPDYTAGITMSTAINTAQLIQYDGLLHAYETSSYVQIDLCDSSGTTIVPNLIANAGYDKRIGGGSAFVSKGQYIKNIQQPSSLILYPLKGAK